MEAGHYQDAEGRHWLHQVYDGSAYGAPEQDTDQWLDPWGKVAEPPEELERLYTRAEVEAEIRSAIAASIREGCS